MYERTIVAADDGGRWVFETTGEPFAFEELAYYRKRVKAERFTSALLYKYLQRLGVPINIEPDWSNALLVERL